MSWMNILFRGKGKLRKMRREEDYPLDYQELESRTLPDASATLAAGLLTVLGDAGSDRININLDVSHSKLVVLDRGKMVGQFVSNQVGNIFVNAGEGNNVVRIADNVL